MIKKNNFKKIFPITLFLLIFLSTGLVLAENTLSEYQPENTYVLALEKDINTTIAGDLFLITAESNIQGTINKDLNAISNNLKVQGVIGDDLRIIASKTEINAYVFNELRVITANLKISNTTIVRGKTTIRASNAIIKGTFNDDVKIKADKIELDALIKKDIVIESKNIVISNQTKILGDLEVPEGTNVPEGIVRGETVFKEIKPETVSTKELLLGKITLFLLAVFLSAFAYLLFKKPSKEIFKNTKKRTARALIIGIIGAIILPVVSIILLVPIITAPIGVIMLLCLLLIMVLSFAYGTILIGRQILNIVRPKHESRAEILIGALVIILLSFIPGLLFITMFLFYALLLGSIILMFFKIKKKPKKIRSTKKITKKTSKKVRA